MTRKNTLLGIAALVAAVAPFASADPLTGEQLKFFQSPLDGGALTPTPGIYPIGASYNPQTDKPAPFPGHDELSTATLLPSGVVGGTMMADDFSDTNPADIGHITWWGSYMGTNAANPPVTVPQFQVSLYTNAFAQNSTGVFSEPGQLIATQTLTLTTAPLLSSSGTFTESAPIPDPGSPDGPLYEYNGELNWNQIRFPDAVYPNVEWLSIVALAPNIPGSTIPQFQWGWHDRDYGIFDPYAAPSDTTAGQSGYHFMDDAVSGTYTGPGGVGNFAPQFYNSTDDGQIGSKDLAFALYTTPVPEPIALPVIAAGMFLLRRNRRA
ncbi:MAG TPA: hypothetical protein VGG44_09850 [Tepidisphaeraceae bacterium]|jgi:hypothetical protein